MHEQRHERSDASRHEPLDGCPQSVIHRGWADLRSELGVQSPGDAAERPEKNPAAWYYLGRIYLSRAICTRRDSALTKAEQLAPDCAKDIAGYRRTRGSRW